MSSDPLVVLFKYQRAVVLTVLHRLMVSSSDRGPARQSVLHHGDRLQRVGHAVRSAKTGRASSVPRTPLIGYSRSPQVTEQMLTNMFIGRPPGNYDRLLDFSRAVTGCLFFVPSATFLDGVAPDEPSPAPHASAKPSPQSVMRAADGSLGIGSLKGSPPHE
jgi:hypothetical protein